MIAFEILGVALLLVVGGGILIGNSKMESVLHREIAESEEAPAVSGQKSA